MTRNLKPAYDLIKEFEGLFLKAYLDPRPKNPIWTIGYGTIRYPNGNPVKKGDVCTQVQAEEYLRFDCEQTIKDIDGLLKVAVSDNQYCALLSFAYNVGTDIDADDIAEGLGDSTLLKKLNAGDVTGAAAEFPKWNKAEGVVLPGLVRRRTAEQKLFTTPSTSNPPAPAAGGLDPGKDEEPATPAWFEPFKKWILLLIEKMFGGPKGPDSGVIPEPPADDMAAKILKLNPSIPPQALVRVLKERETAVNKSYVTVVNENLYDYERRFIYIDCNTFKSRNELVAQGGPSDANKDNLPDHFSNVSGSGMTSLGVFIYGKNYVSVKHYIFSRRLIGKTIGMNDHMLDRGVVFHNGEKYVNDVRAAAHNIGDSLGCLTMDLKPGLEINATCEGSAGIIWHDSLLNKAI